jgi:hypothetical protein
VAVVVNGPEEYQVRAGDSSSLRRFVVTTIESVIRLCVERGQEVRISGLDDHGLQGWRVEVGVDSEPTTRYLKTQEIHAEGFSLAEVVERLSDADVSEGTQ